MPSKCPLCGQPLPHALNPDELQSRLQALSTPLIAQEKAKLKADFDSRVASAVETNQRAAERQFQNQLKLAEERARVTAQREMSKQIQAAERRASVAESQRLAAATRARKEAEAQAKRELAQTLKLADARNEAKLAKSQADRQRDRQRFEAESARLQGKLDELSRKLDKQSGEQLGSEAERDLLADLRAAFPQDRIERIGKGVKGGDIVQTVMDGSQQVGKIIYESKNTLTWLNDFIVQAKQYRAQYETPYVMVVTRTFPAKQKGFCIVKDVPVVEPRMASEFARVIRDGIVEIAKLRISASRRDGKAQELYEYVVSDKFSTRFRELAEGIDGLRQQQLDERRSHEKAWQLESRLHDQIASRHSEVEAQIRAICGGRGTVEGAKLPSRPALRPGSPYIAASSR